MTSFSGVLCRASSNLWHRRPRGQSSGGKLLLTNSQENYFVGKPTSDILFCAKHSFNGVTMRISFRMSTNDFVVISESNKQEKPKVFEASLFVKK